MSWIELSGDGLRGSNGTPWRLWHVARRKI